MADWSQWMRELPELNLPGDGFLAQAGDAGTGTVAPSGPKDVETQGNSPLIYAAIAVVVIVVIIVAVRSFRSPDDKPGDKPETPPEKTRSPDAPTKDILSNRETRDIEDLEINEDDSLAEIKDKKASKVKVESYEDAKAKLQARKAGQVKKAQKEMLAERLSQDEESSVDESAEADEAKAEETPQKDDDAKPAESEEAEEAAKGDEADDSAEEKKDSDVPSIPALDLPDLGSKDGEDVDSGWGEINFDALSLSTSTSLSGMSFDEPTEIPNSAEIASKAAERVSEDESVAEEEAPAEAEAAPEEAAEAAPKEEAVEEPAAEDHAKAEEEASAEAPEAEEAVEAEPKEEAKAEEPKKDEPKKEAPKKEERVSPRMVEPTSKDAVTSLQDGLQKTRGGFMAKLSTLFKRQSEIDDQLLDEMEEVLYTSDMGPQSVETLLERVRTGLDEEAVSDSGEVWRFLRREVQAILTANESPLVIERQNGMPQVILVVGVNGVGKTTTIGKLAMRYTDGGARVLMVAGDTFRAAATEQLEEWGERTGLEVHTAKDGADPASVVYEGIERAMAEEFDVVLCDTAGRLTNKKNLMKELEKIGRVAGKALEGAPHETLLVLDANTGLMALQQARMFQEVSNVTGIVLTKLDGTAKGGVVIAICEELGVPVRYIGIGEQVYDLRPFNAVEFADALFM